MAESEHPKNDGASARRVPVKSWKEWDKWTAEDAFGWIHLIH